MMCWGLHLLDEINGKEEVDLDFTEDMMKPAFTLLGNAATQISRAVSPIYSKSIIRTQCHLYKTEWRNLQ